MQVTVTLKRRAVTPSKDTFMHINRDFLIPQRISFSTIYNVEFPFDTKMALLPWKAEKIPIKTEKLLPTNSLSV